MWGVLEPRIESVRRELARDFGCDPEEMAITRNASEANETMIFGLELQRGDEVDRHQPELRPDAHHLGPAGAAGRHRGQAVSFKVPPPSPAYIVDQFRRGDHARGPGRSKSPTSPTSPGQIMPVRELVRVGPAPAASRCSSTAPTPTPISRSPATTSSCDYYGTSLHKWLLAPIGTGFLYVRKDRQKTLWPLMAAPASMDDNVRKYEEIGTHPAANHNAIAAALAFHRRHRRRAEDRPAPLPPRPVGQAAARRRATGCRS